MIRSLLPRSRRGSTLIIVVIFLALLTVLVLGFLARALLDLEISDSSANRNKGDTFARGAVDCIIGDLKQEIVDGSSLSPGSTSNSPVYIPNASKNMVPAYSGFTPSYVVPETDGYANLLKLSQSGAPFYTGSTINRASGIPTSQSSLDNRSISIADWNKPLLMPVNTNLPVTPDWIYVARDGSNPGSTSNLAAFGKTGTTVNNSASSNSSFVVGRYAYTIYNEGGLLDANVAGTPDISNLSTAQNQIWTRKGPAVFADLTQLPTLSTLGSTRAQSIVDNLIAWRSQASAQPNGNFPAYTFSNAGITRFLNFQLGQTTSWMTTGSAAPVNNQSDRMFTSRQQLISFLEGVAGNSTELTALENTLQYLTSYSRSLNQPSYAPPAGRPMVVSVQAGAMSGNYNGGNSAYGLDNVYNPVFRSVRVINAFTRNDGSIAQVGDPLVEKRFALSRLCWLTYKGPSANLATSDPLIQLYTNTYGVSQALLNEGTATNIYNYFGLKWTAGSASGGVGGFWTYSHGISSTGATVIGSLSDPSSTSSPRDVQTAGRDPDFFELLKAGVCVGALAKTKTGNIFGTSYSAITESTVTFQVLQLGANIITQANPTQYPIWIKYNYGDSNGYLRSFFGSTDLPYFYSDVKVAFVTSQPAVAANPGGNIWPPYSGIFSETNPPTTTGTPALSITNAGQVAAMIFPTIWNPYDPNGPGGTNLPISTSLAPTQLRITVVPAAVTDYTNLPGGSSSGAPPAVTPAGDQQWQYSMQSNAPFLNTAGTYTTAQMSKIGTVTAKWYSEDSTAMVFNNVNSLYRQPTMLFQQNVPSGSNLSLGSLNTSGGPCTEASTGTSFIGFYLGSMVQAWTSTAPTAPTPPAPPNPTIVSFPSFPAGTYLYVGNTVLLGHPGSGSTIRLEYNAGSSGNPYWIPYQEVYINFDNDGICVPIVEAANSTNPSLLVGADSLGNTGLLAGNFGPTASATTSPTYGGPGYGAFWGSYAFDPRSTRWGAGVIKGNPTFSGTTYTGQPNPKFIDVTHGIVQSERPDGPSLLLHLFGYSVNNSSPGVYNNELWSDASIFNSTNMGGVSQNLNIATCEHYEDADGIVRRTMGGLVNSATPAAATALPMATPSSPSSTPIMLHRPFRTVAELGYVFSDTPWRNIDFFTPESGYAPLLDIFCINEDYRPDALVAGKVDLNTRQEPVLQALLSGTYRDESAVAGNGADTPLSTAEATSIAKLLLARTLVNNGATGKGPLTNISELVGHYTPGFANSNGTNYDGFSGDIVGAYSGTSTSVNNLVQRFLEATPRALSDSGQVGTWNLLIDVVAQTGRCSTTAQLLSDFLVQGERHYWVHVSIDRQTGKVIDENIEPVNL